MSKFSSMGCRRWVRTPNIAEEGEAPLFIEELARDEFQIGAKTKEFAGQSGQDSANLWSLTITINRTSFRVNPATVSGSWVAIMIWLIFCSPTTSFRRSAHYVRTQFHYLPSTQALQRHARAPQKQHTSRRSSLPLAHRCFATARSPRAQIIAL